MTKFQPFPHSVFRMGVSQCSSSSVLRVEILPTSNSASSKVLSLLCARLLFKNMRPGAYSHRFLKNSEPMNTPKEWFLSGKRPKEGERVVLGHFHERVGESPGPLDMRILAPADLKNLFWFPSYGHLKMPGSKSHFPYTF